MKTKLIIFFFTIVLLIITSCSKTKDKGYKQYKTNFISYYNTYFNIKQRYKIGYREAIYQKQENTNNIISVFEFENDPKYFEPIAQFNETNAKVSKLLALRPNNKWMDDAILIEGKIRYLKGDLDSAVLLLTYLVDYYPKGYVAGHLPAGKLKGFDEKVREAIRKNEPIHQPKFGYKFARNEGIIWLVKAMIKKKQYERAQSLILQMESDMGFPVEYRNDLLKTQIMLNIETKNLSKATENLTKLLEDKKLSKKDRSRMNFILAQIYEKDKKNALAKQYYEAALEGKLKDDLDFEARLRALSYSESSPDESMSQLKKMLNKGKYASNQDKIYFALGNLQIAKNEIDPAMKSYVKAIELSKNPNLKFLIFEKIGSINYAKSNYVLAAKYYDSALLVMPENYEFKKEFAKKAEALKKLQLEYNIFIAEDSILNLADLGPEKARKAIEKTIRKEYEQELAKQKSKDAQILAGESVKNNTPSGQWYFSNKELIEKGRLNFQKKWGKLTLQDNWKRISSNNNSESTAKGKSGEKPELEESSIDLIAEIEASKLPFSQEAKKPIIQKVQKALANMGRIYQYEIVDLNKAIETYELLLKKYPNEIANHDEILYTLYRLYVENENIAEAEKVKTKLLSLYPSSKFSLYAANPNAKSEDEKSEYIVSKKYKEAYRQYRLANYTESLAQCDLIISEFPNHSLISKVKLLKAFNYSYSNQSSIYLTTLQDIVALYPTTEEGKTAQEFLDMIAKMKSEPAISEKPKESTTPSTENQESLTSINKESFPVDKVPGTESAKIKEQPGSSSPKSISQPIASGKEIVNFSFRPSSPHYLIYVLNNTLKTSSIQNLLEVFVKSKGNLSKLKIDNFEIEAVKYVTVGRFKDYTEVSQFNLKNESDILLKKLIDNSERYYISAENLDILYVSEGWQQYVTFYEKNYK